jgi:ferredoxin
MASSQLLRLVTCKLLRPRITNPQFNLFSSISTESAPKLKKAKVSVTFVKNDGEKITAEGKEGDSILDIVVNNSVDLNGYGACEGTLACSTCHVILKNEDYAKLPDKPTDEELDMLDLAFGLADTSRLGCQICITKELSGIEVKVPEGVNDVRNS